MKKNVLWIDDKASDRKYLAEKVRAEFIVSEKDIPKQCDKYDLILIDYHLNKPAFSTNGYALGSRIREKTQTVPIYIISNYLDPQKKNERFFCAANFQKIINISDFKPNDIINDSRYFHKLMRNIPCSAGDILKLLKVPTSSQERLRKAVLPNITTRGGDSERIFGLSEWITQVLMKYPGPLYDEQNLRAHLGITNKAFFRIKSKFERAKYRGIFSKSADNHWWSDEVDKIIFSDKRVKELGTFDIPRLAEKVFSLRPNDLNKCAVCGKKYPDILASEKDTKDSLQNIHYGCSEEDSERPKYLCFDSPRCFSIDT